MRTALCAISVLLLTGATGCARHVSKTTTHGVTVLKPDVDSTYARIDRYDAVDSDEQLLYKAAFGPLPGEAAAAGRIVPVEPGRFEVEVQGSFVYLVGVMPRARSIRVVAGAGIKPPLRDEHAVAIQIKGTDHFAYNLGGLSFTFQTLETSGSPKHSVSVPPGKFIKVASTGEYTGPTPIQGNAAAESFRDFLLDVHKELAF